MRAVSEKQGFGVAVCAAAADKRVVSCYRMSHSRPASAGATAYACVTQADKRSSQSEEILTNGLTERRVQQLFQ